MNATRPYLELSLAAQTAYAQLLQDAVAADHHRSVADLPGSFSTKTVRGKTYWYYQYSQPSGRLIQTFVGPDNDATRMLVALKKESSPHGALSRLSRAAAALGCASILPKHAKVISRLSDYGFFHAGGVLIGTHAFLAYGNMLGVRWSGSDQTHDLDLAHSGKNLSVALPTNLQINAESAIHSLEMGLLPVASLTDKSGATYLNPRDPEFRIDFLTPQTDKVGAPFRHENLGVSLQPLRFMEYSLEAVEQAVLFSGDTVIVVNVPAPARYALHKLLIHAERSGAFTTKSNKDIEQAGLILCALIHGNRRSDIDQAYEDLVSRGKGWRSRVEAGLGALEKRFPELRELVHDLRGQAPQAKPATNPGKGRSTLR